MQKKMQFNINEKLHEQIIAVAYKNAGIFTRIKISGLSKRNPEIKKMLQEYSLTASSLKCLELENCPNQTSFDVQKKLELLQSEKTNFIANLFAIYLKRPIVSVAASGLLVFAIIFSSLNSNRIAHTYSNKQIAEADFQIKKSFAQIGKILKSTTNTIEKLVLKENLGKNLNEGFGLVNNLLGENKNEKTN